MINKFILEIKKVPFFSRNKITLITICVVYLFFVALIINAKIFFLDRILSITVIYLITTLIVLLSLKKSAYKIQISQDGIIINYLNFNKDLICQLEYQNLSVQVFELVRRSGKIGGTIVGYAIKFNDGKNKYTFNNDNEWSFSDIHKIISELEIIRRNNSFMIDGFHFKKDIEYRMKKIS